jgi:hypothetical protein
MSTRDAAVAAAREGWAVFPCLPRDKRPAVDRWEERACSDPDRVARYWPSGRHNVGCACGPSSRVVIDLDTHGTLPDDWRLPGIRDGQDVLAQLCEWAGQPWPVTRTKRTPLDGWHLEFLAPAGMEIRNSAGKIGPLIDVRGAGGYVLAAGSVLDGRAYPDDPASARIMKDGRAYEVINGTCPVPLPEWLAILACPPPPAAASRPHAAATQGTPDARLRGLVKTVRESQPGDRTGPLVWAAHRLREMAADGEADSATASELLIRAAVEAGIRGGERYARQQVQHVLGGGR